MAAKVNFKELEFEFAKGTCMTMCPREEMLMREREGLLHILEMLPGTEKQRRPKAASSRVVKSYSRCAAGQNKQVCEDLRPPAVLLQTVNYLLQDVLMLEDWPLPLIYDYITDRLQAVRQDMVVQNITRPYFISILQPIVRYHAYASYRLCEEHTTKFNSVINNEHFRECLKRLLVLYDYYDILDDMVSVMNTLEMNCRLFEDSRPYFESLYLLFNLGNTTAIARSLNLPQKWRMPLVELCLAISLHYVKGNWVQVCRLMLKLPTILAAVCAVHLPTIRRKALHVMSIAYNSKQLSFPVDSLAALLLYETTDELVSDCKYYNVVSDEISIYFEKGSFNSSKKMPGGWGNTPGAPGRSL